ACLICWGVMARLAVMDSPFVRFHLLQLLASGFWLKQGIKACIQEPGTSSQQPDTETIKK
ncbi:MAG: hypothetical protein PVG68_01465, partial [Desulfobacterales bacterium]